MTLLQKHTHIPTTTMAAAPTASFTGLPQELRDDIYSFLLVSPDKITLGPRTDNTENQQEDRTAIEAFYALSATCRLTRYDASECFYKKNKFAIYPFQQRMICVPFDIFSPCYHSIDYEVEDIPMTRDPEVRHDKSLAGGKYHKRDDKFGMMRNIQIHVGTWAFADPVHRHASDWIDGSIILENRVRSRKGFKVAFKMRHESDREYAEESTLQREVYSRFDKWIKAIGDIVRGKEILNAEMMRRVVDECRDIACAMLYGYGMEEQSC